MTSHTFIMPAIQAKKTQLKRTVPKEPRTLIATNSQKLMAAFSTKPIDTKEFIFKIVGIKNEKKIKPENNRSLNLTPYIISYEKLMTIASQLCNIWHLMRLSEEKTIIEADFVAAFINSPQFKSIQRMGPEAISTEQIVKLISTELSNPVYAEVKKQILNNKINNESRQQFRLKVRAFALLCTTFFHGRPESKEKENNTEAYQKAKTLFSNYVLPLYLNIYDHIEDESKRWHQAKAAFKTVDINNPSKLLDTAQSLMSQWEESLKSTLKNTLNCESNDCIFNNIKSLQDDRERLIETFYPPLIPITNKQLHKIIDPYKNALKQKNIHIE